MADIEYAEGDIVTYRGREFVVGVDNGHAVHLPDLPDAWSIDESHIYRGDRPRAGEWGGPPRYNRWIAKSLLGKPPGDLEVEATPNPLEVNE